jgi:hypothetical protein
MTAGDVTLVIALFVMVAGSLYFRPRIHAERIAMQWGFDLKPTWYAPKIIGLWALPVVVVCIRVLIYAAERYRPELVHDLSLGLIVMAVIVTACHFIILRAAAR